MGGRHKDLTGQQFGSWTVLGKVDQRSKNGSIRWRVKCACGEEKLLTTSTLNSGASKSCRRCSNRHAFGEAAKKGLYNFYKAEARKRKHPFELTKEDFYALTEAPCFYCGVEPVNKYKARYGHYIYNGIDRVDNTKGYTRDNCLPCCKDCNIAKRTRTLKEFTSWAMRLGKHITSMHAPSKARCVEKKV